MDRWYLPADNTDGSARAATLGCSLYGPVSPWQTAALTRAAIVRPAVVLASGQIVYAALADTNLALAKATVDTAAAPFLAAEQTQATQAANQQTIASNIAAALTRLQQIQTQASTFQGQGTYGTANLANLNDLLSKCQTMAGAVHDVAQDLVWIARQLSTQFDATT